MLSLRLTYFVSRCMRCTRHRGQYFINSRRFGSLRLFLRVVYVRSLHSVHASCSVGRFSAIAICYSVIFVIEPAPTVRPPSRIAKR